jgi:alpha-L-fucosidase 2
MKKGLLLLGLVLNVIALNAQTAHEIKFNKAATHFTQSCPLGNGRLGAMVFGNPNQERIILNEQSMWSGGIENPNRNDAATHLPSIQQLLSTGKTIGSRSALGR